MFGRTGCEAHAISPLTARLVFKSHKILYNKTAHGDMNEMDVHRIVRRAYANRATGKAKGCCAKKCSELCPSSRIRRAAEQMGYTKKDLEIAPEDSNLGLGCGAPLRIAAVSKGETVLDLGSGAGFDAFLAANEVGETGRVIGVDMTPEMIEKARANAQNGSSEEDLMWSSFEKERLNRCP